MISHQALKEQMIKEHGDRLSDLQFNVAFEEGTERPFMNKYYDNDKEGIYLSVVSEVPLFSSKDKFDSGTGWPSFSKPIETEFVKETTDRAHGMVRTEVSCKTDTIHLGHIFGDGPQDKGGQRYCINSASLKFKPLSEMTADEKDKYGFK